MFVVSAYMSNKKTGNVQTADADAWRVTSETKNAQSPVMEAKAPNNSIAQDGEKYNCKNQHGELGPWTVLPKFRILL